MVAVFLATLPAMALGVAMTLARTAWYPAYATRSSQPLVDQQLAGVVMWAYGGLAAVIGGVALFMRWLRGVERAFPGGHASPVTGQLGGTPPC